MHKTISKKPVLKKAGFKPKQIIPKEKIMLIENKKAVFQVITRLSKTYSNTKPMFSLMLDIINKSKAELSSLKKQLEKDKLYNGEIEKKYIKVENKRKQFIYDFLTFLDYSISVSKNPKLKDLDLMSFTIPEITAKSYKREFGELVSEIVKLK
ncbi:MAG: hypothetical protein PHF68_03805 [Candidatus ainarchaeum sp.]|nr:hypothetical protein [Candidatus ainarchaeum sp.]